MRTTRALVVMLTLIGLLASVQAQAATVEQVILVLWHGLTWADVDTFQLEGPVAWGLLNTRSGGGDPVVGGYLSIGAGARAVGLAGGANFQTRDSAEHVYRLHTGSDPGSYVQPNIALINRAQTVSYQLQPGALGQAFYDAGHPVRVLGNSNGFENNQWAALVGMDSLGRVWEGNIEERYTTLDPRYPFGMRTDYSRLAEDVLGAKDPLVIVDLGDPYRYDIYERALLDGQKEVKRAVMVAEAHEFLQTLIRNKGPQAVVFVVSPYPAQELASRGFWLTPVLCAGIGDGLLNSGTTKWPGLITNMDVAPTILELLRLDYRPFIGRPALVEPISGGKSKLTLMLEKIEVLFQQRSQVLRVVVVTQILVYGLILASLILNHSLPGWALWILQTSLLVLMSVPLSLLLWDQSKYLVLAVPLLLIIFALRTTQPLKLMGAVALLTAVAISIDVLRGSWLMRYSPLGYDPVGGARFYGIGNEFMGVVVGSAIIGWAVVTEYASYHQWQKIVGFLFFAGLVVIIGYPALGTNVGGAISAVFGFGSTLFALSNKKINNLRAGLILVLVLVVVLGSFMILDAANPEHKQSHIGQTFELFRREGVNALLLIVERKLAMNIRLLRYSIWSRALIVTLGVMAASFVWPSRFIFWLKKTHPFVAKGIGGVVIGAIFALIFNDSGVVAAATCLSFGSAPLLLLALELKHNLAAS